MELVSILKGDQSLCLLSKALRDVTEWRRWEESNKWMWDGEKRRRWAEALWRRQHTRKIQLADYLRNKARAEAKYKMEQENEARRRARYGPSSMPQNPFSGLGFFLLTRRQVAQLYGRPPRFTSACFSLAAVSWLLDSLDAFDKFSKSLSPNIICSAQC